MCPIETNNLLVREVLVAATHLVIVGSGSRPLAGRVRVGSKSSSMASKWVPFGWRTFWPGALSSGCFVVGHLHAQLTAGSRNGRILTMGQ
jgi:hypothetical protein